MTRSPARDGSDPRNSGFDPTASTHHDDTATAPPDRRRRRREAEIQLDDTGRGTKREGARVAAERRTTPDGHLLHARQHFERLASGMTALAKPEQIFLGLEDEEFFWELIGFKLAGHPSLLFGAVRFRRHELPGVLHGREPLAAYLEGPSGSLETPSLATPPGTIPMLLPRDHENIPSFLRGLRAGRPTGPVFVDATRILVAFDLRLTSPASLPALCRRAGPLRQHIFRTDRGHVLAGLSHGPGGGPHSRGRFVVVKETRQVTPRGKLPLPNLVLNRDFLTLAAEVDSRDRDMAAARWVPFSASTATTRHLLLG